MLRTFSVLNHCNDNDEMMRRLRQRFVNDDKRFVYAHIYTHAHKYHISTLAHCTLYVCLLLTNYVISCDMVNDVSFVHLQVYTYAFGLVG